jgi:hypothetical protein
MPRKSRFISFLPVFFVLLFGCSADQSVVSDHWLQKRKHRPGFHLNWKKEQPRKELVNAHDSSRNRKLEALDLLTVKTPSDALDQASLEASKVDVSRDRHVRPPLKKVSAVHPQGKRPSLQAQATERTEELEILKEERRRNKNNLLASGFLTFGSIFGLAIALGVLALTGLFTIGTLIIGNIAFSILPYALPLFIIFLKERSVLNNGEVYFDNERTNRFLRVAQKMNKSMRDAFVAIAIGGITLLMSTVIGIPAFLIIALMILGTGLLFFSIASIAAFVSSAPLIKRSDEGRKIFGRSILFTILLSVLLSIIGLGLVIVV